MKISKQQTFAHNVGLLINYIFNMGFHCTLGEAFRTPEQAEIYARTGKGIKNSLHCKRLAIDLNVFDQVGNYLDKSEDLEPFGRYWEKLNSENKWGGNFMSAPKDGNHFEMRDLL